jgi:putative transposase
MTDFQPGPISNPRPGMVLRVIKDGHAQFLRLTHVFDECMYAMWVGEPNEARTARRPRKFSLIEIDGLMKQANSTWGPTSPPVCTTCCSR